MRANNLKPRSAIVPAAHDARMGIDQAGSHCCKRGKGFDGGTRREGLLEGQPWVDYSSQSARIRIHYDYGVLASCKRLRGGAAKELVIIKRTVRRIHRRAGR